MPLPHDLFAVVLNQRSASNIIDVDRTQLYLRMFAVDILQFCLGAHDTSDFQPNYKYGFLWTQRLTVDDLCKGLRLVNTVSRKR